MASSWETIALDKLIVPGRGISYGIVQPGSPTVDGVPIVRVSDVRDGRIATQEPLRVSPAIEAAHSRTRLKGGELLLTIVGTIGETAIVPVALAGWNTARAVAVIPVREDVGAYWVQLALRGPAVREIIDSRLNTTVQATLNLRDVAQLPIVLPPQREREAITNILGTLDDKIELNRRMNETLEAMARALFKSWFVDFDPVRAKAASRPSMACGPRLAPIGEAERRDSGLPTPLADLFPDSFEDSELGEIPKGWKVGRLAEVTGFLGGYAFKSKDWIEQGVPVVKIGSVKPGLVDLSAGSYVSDEVAEEAQRFRLAPGDLLIGMTGYVGEVGLVPHTDNPPLLNQRVGKFVLEKPGTAALAFLYCLTRQPEFKAQVEAKSHGTAQANVSAEGILSIQTVVPPKTVRDEYNRIGQPLIDRILTNHAECAALADQRDALLPKLISGELRLKGSERNLESVA